MEGRLMESWGNHGNCVSLSNREQRQLPLLQQRKALKSRKDCLSHLREAERPVWTAGEKMLPALNYLWSCCYFDYDGARTACMVISRGLQKIAQEFSTVASTSSPPSFSQTTKPKWMCFVLNGHGLKYETRNFGLRTVNRWWHLYFFWSLFLKQR